MRNVLRTIASNPYLRSSGMLHYYMSAKSASDHWAYRLEKRHLLMLRIVHLFPPALRERFAERFLRRPSQPGPAAEHVIQYVVSDTIARRRRDDRNSVDPAATDRSERKPIVVGQADFFYRSQYRSRCSAVMGAFAATATLVLASSGTAPQGRLWRRHRNCASAMLPRHGETGIRPILVLDEGAVAVAVMIQRSGNPSTDRATEAWMFKQGPRPDHLSRLLRGDLLGSEPGVGQTVIRDHIGSVVELIEAARASGHLALLALHQSDPDAMGLHITLFGVETVDPDRLISDYGLSESDIESHRASADAQDSILGYLVGGTAEVFTQCSQNLFVKELASDPSADSGDRLETPPVTLDDFLAVQFETAQVTVNASGLPGGSPRNGPIGGAAFIDSRKGRKYVLIPYHPGNAIHGHAAKLWSNRRAALVVTDDHTHRRRATITGESWVMSHEQVTKRFPSTSLAVTHPESGDSATVAEPVYWFVTRVDMVVWERELLPAYRLEPGRDVCTINAGGEGRHTKKPKYFDAGSIDPYDMGAQHLREASGRPIDPTGKAREAWIETVTPAMAAREEHLASIGLGATDH
ncbi:MAG: hypothetical protein WCJ88_11315 [Actinomycetes bacterium]